MTSKPRQLYVYIQLPGSVELVTCGRLTWQRLRSGQAVGDFLYGKSYRERSNAVSIDPIHLPLTSSRRKQRNGAWLTSSDAWRASGATISHERACRPTTSRGSRPRSCRPGLRSRRPPRNHHSASRTHPT